MPTRTQQGDILSSAYASHGDTKHPLLFPSTPTECFELTAGAFDLADKIQSPVILMTDLDLGMNDHMTAPFNWDDSRKLDHGKVLNKEQLYEAKDWGRYLDMDGDGIPYRTIPGTHESKGAYVARGTSRNRMAAYTENSWDYQDNMDRLSHKWETTKKLVPSSKFHVQGGGTKEAMLFFGTTTHSALEARDVLAQQGTDMDALELKAFPFDKEVCEFIEKHDKVYVIEQNRDAQMRQLLISELNADPHKFISVLNYDGKPITSDFIATSIADKAKSLAH